MTRLLLAFVLLFGACGARHDSGRGSPAGPVIAVVGLVALVAGAMVVLGLVADCERREGGQCGSAGARQAP